MADFQNVVVTSQAAANVNVPRYSVSVQVTDSTTGALLADFTGANAIQWPGVLATLTAEQRRAILEMVLTYVVRVKAGLQ